MGTSTEWCIPVSSSVRVCDVVAADRSIKLELIAGSSTTVLNTDRFAVYEGMVRVLQADLDANGAGELIVVDLTGTTNGLAMTSDRISIVENAEGPKPTWISFVVREFGHGPGTFVRRAGQPGNWILSTEWERSGTLDPQRGIGSYLVGRWFRYEKGRLVSEPGIVVRRLLNSFLAERSTDLEHQPYSFFLNGNGRMVAQDPGLGTGEVLSTIAGTITAITADGDYEILRNDGRKTRATFSIPYGDNPPEHIDHVGLSSIKRVLPEGVPPSALGIDAVGHVARLIRYRDGKDSDKRVLWLD